MAPSQLKQLKSSLREKGIVAPQQSKKQKRKNAKSGATAGARLQRNAALQSIREQFNPFEVRAPSRPSKFAVTTNRGDPEVNQHRPGVSKSLGEERRKDTLLKEIHSRNRIGGITDRRFGEDDPTITPEQRAAERFARESQKKFKKESMFNLEDDEEDEMQLTHMGMSLGLDQKNVGDDFKEDDLTAVDDEAESELNKKRKRFMEEDDMGGLADDSDEEEEEEGPERKKSKNEVMKELIAKSKLYKYERQKAKEDDSELRDTLDKGLRDIFDLMQATKKPEPKKQPEPVPAPQMNPDRAALLNGGDRDTADREYDQRLRQMAFDQRSKPSDRTKTEEEKIADEAERLQQLEKERLRRMNGEDVEESEEEEVVEDDLIEHDSEPDDAKRFGLHQTDDNRPDLDVEDEDDFIIDDDLVETGSAADLSLSEESASEESEEEQEIEDDGDDEFINGLELPRAQSKGTSRASGAPAEGSSLAFTYPCPETHEQFLATLKEVDIESVPTVIQRIRALHHPRLHADNKAKLGVFAKVLVEHLGYSANQPSHPPFPILENLLRHIHSLSKTHPEEVATAFRAHLRDIMENRPLQFLPGDLILLTGVATVFPTSDHFHAVVTPSILSMGRYLGQSSFHSLGDVATGAYVGSLCLQYQMLAKRYMPELINYILNSLCFLAPTEPTIKNGSFPLRTPSEPMRLQRTKVASKAPRKLRFWDTIADPSLLSKDDAENLKLSLLSTFTSLLGASADLWNDKSAFSETFTPARAVLRHLIKSCSKIKLPATFSDQLQQTFDKLNQLLAQAKQDRHPLLLHNHRPLPIKSSIPKFEETFNPHRHYDPDRERAEMSKLKAEHKRERKGAMRELRKDANFIARESLREKKEKDAEYERKYRRLVAEIQGEEGREAKSYEREKQARKQSRK